MISAEHHIVFSLLQTQARQVRLKLAARKVHFHTDHKWLLGLAEVYDRNSRFRDALAVFVNVDALAKLTLVYVAESENLEQMSRRINVARQISVRCEGKEGDWCVQLLTQSLHRVQVQSP